jgi:hypothetical protein
MQSPRVVSARRAGASERREVGRRRSPPSTCAVGIARPSGAPAGEDLESAVAALGDVVLEPPPEPSAFLNIRVADIQAAYQQWRSRGAVFLTPPKDHGREIRCYMRDPDGHLIEVRQTTGALRNR